MPVFGASKVRFHRSWAVVTSPAAPTTTTPRTPIPIFAPSLTVFDWARAVAPTQPFAGLAHLSGRDAERPHQQLGGRPNQERHRQDGDHDRPGVFESSPQFGA